MASSSQQHRCVFVGNIPYDATEEQLVQICEEVGPVVSFRLVIDRETGKPKGYGFCEYKDEETALSARRNLQGYEINGRQLRVDFAENDKGADRNREQGRGGPGIGASADQQKQFGGPAIGGDSALHQSIGLPLAMTGASIMAGALGGAQSGGQSNGLPHQPMLGNDPLTLHLAKMSRSRLTQVMCEMKVLAAQNKDLARQILLGCPQLLKALFQAQIMLGMVTPQMLQLPNIRQASAPISQPSVQAGQLSQQHTTTSIPGLPPLAPLTSAPQSSLVPNQFSASMQLPPLQPRIPPPNLPQVGALHHSMVIPHSGAVTVPSARPQPLGGMPTGGQMQGGPSPRPVQPPLLHNRGHVGPGISGHSQLSLPNASFQPSHLNGPRVQGPGFQMGSSRYPGTSEINKETAVVGQMNANANFSPTSSSRQDVPEQTGRPMMYVKMDDSKRSSFPANDLASSVASESKLPSAFEVGSVAPNHSSRAEPHPNLEIEGAQSQIPPDKEAALLQQVLNLTPEQLSTLPPEQLQQVLQLQKMLR